MNKGKAISYLLVALQLVGVGLIGFYKNGIPTNAIFAIIEFAGLFLVIWSFFIMKIENFKFTSEPKTEATLIKKGPYAIIRHPMYSSIIVTAVPMTIDYFSITRLIILISLITILVFKAEHEEKILIKHFKDYPEYQKKTFKIITFVY